MIDIIWQKKKDELEKEYSNLQFQTTEEKERAKRDIDSLIKKKNR